MPPTLPPKPRSVTAVQATLGLLAFISVAQCFWVTRWNSEEAMARVFMTVVLNAGFVGALTLTRWGRIVAMAVLALLASSTAVSMFFATRYWIESPISVALLWVLGGLFLALIYAYIRGEATRHYFAARRAQSPAANPSRTLG